MNASDWIINIFLLFSLVHENHLFDIIHHDMEPKILEYLDNWHYNIIIIYNKIT